MNPTPKKSPAQSIGKPIVPQSVRPLATPKAAQPKMANGVAQRKPPVGPPVYSPQPAPKVLQPKSSSTIQRQCKHGYANKNKCPHCKQSQQDRNVNKFVAYQTPNKKTIEKDVEKVKELKTNLAHGSKNNQYGQSGRTKNLLNELNEK